MGTKYFPRSKDSSPEKSTRTDPGLAALQNCPVCAKEFINLDRLTRHRNAATCRSAAHMCWLETCERRFSQAAHLANHRLFHVDERRYVCQACLARFRAAESLSLHLTVVHAQVAGS
jgi:hypothetical protein